jgi:putative transport protein
MEFLRSILPSGSVASGIMTLAMAVVLGLGLGAIRIRGVALGVAAVLFSALVVGAMGFKVDPDVLSFLRDFALILFVYVIGLQLGPGFGASLKAEGLQLNAYAFVVVTGGAVATFLIVKLMHMPAVVAPGLYAGGFATSPALAAGQDALQTRLSQGHNLDSARAAVKSASLVFAVAYPFGLLGPIPLVIALRWLFRVNMADERRSLAAAEEIRRPPLGYVDVEVTNESCFGKQLKDDSIVSEKGVTFTRLLRGGVMTVPTADTRIEPGDVFRAFGPLNAVSAVVAAVGREKPIDLSTAGGNVMRERVVVTNRVALGRTLKELDLINRFNVTVGRVNRAGIDIPPRARLALKFGDQVDIVGQVDRLKAVEELLGNSLDVLNRPQLIPIFLGIVLGVFVGSIPLAIPGLGGGLRIGLAGGPMIVAILLSRLGNFGSIVWYMPASASNLFRDFGMAVFLACVGLESGGDFIHTVASREGLMAVMWGACITIVPMMIVALIARWLFKMNFITLSGLTAGAMTSSPTLLFSNDFTGSPAPSVAYAAVYPLSVIVPVFCAQFLAAAMT